MNKNNRDKKNKKIEKIKVSTQPYKGVRDFYPEDWRIQKWIFKKMSEVCERYGYENYSASPLEYSDLFIAKSGREIVENETYNLIDRGGREVTIRPEMTPTVARMVAKKEKELPKPIKWYSIPNLFRYEKPQKGRLREHYQLNVDIFGVSNIEADIEVISLGNDIMLNLGAKQKDFVIRISDRKVINAIFKKFTDDSQIIYELSKLIDKKKKIPEEVFNAETKYLLGDKKGQDFIDILNNSTVEYLEKIIDKKILNNIKTILKRLTDKKITSAVFDITLMRGFDYYTDIVFEFFDNSPENNRSLFGGGRYDDLLDIFGKPKIPAFGFGMGDVTARDFLEAHNLLPELKTKTQISILPFSEKENIFAIKIADFLRDNKINVDIDFSDRKLPKKINSAEKKGIKFFLTIGENEAKTSLFKIKNMNTGETFENITKEEIINKIK